MPALAPCVEASLTRFAEEVRRVFGPRAREIALFGSHARGEANEESDVDVVVIIDDLTSAERRQIFELATEIDRTSDEWVGLSPLPYSTMQARDLRERERRLFRDIDREGVRL